MRVRGELDRDTAHHLLDAVVMLSTRPARQWRLDVGGVTFCDAAGLRALAGAHTLAADSGRSLRVSPVSRPVTRLVRLVGPEQGFPDAGPRGIRWGTTGTA